MQDLNSLSTLRSRDAISFSHLNFRLSGDPVSSVHGQARVGKDLSLSAKRAPIGWIPVNSLLRVHQLGNSVRASRSQSESRCLFIPSDPSPWESKHEFYWELSRPI